MKSFVTAFLSLTIITLSAQEGFVPRVYELTKAPKQKIQNHKPQIPNSNKSPGDTIFYEDFDSVRWGGTSNNGEAVPENAPEGYTLWETHDCGFHWKWSKVGPRGAYTSPTNACEPSTPLFSTTGDNGFLMYEADWYCTKEGCVLDDWYCSFNAYVEYSSLDLSAFSTVHIRLEQKSRFCCGYDSESNSFFEISINNGDTWIKYDVSPTPINVGSDNPTKTELDLSSIAGGQENVTFRFHFTGLSHYHWEIDDVLFFEPHEYDLQLIEIWDDYMTYNYPNCDNVNESINYYGDIYYQPWFAMHPFVGFRGKIKNYGSKDRTNVIHHVDIYRNGSYFAGLQSNGATLNSWELDTFNVDFSNTPEGDFYDVIGDSTWYTNAKGAYETKHYITADGDECSLLDDSLSLKFNIVDTTFCYVRQDPVYLTKKITTPNDTYCGPEGLGIHINLPDPSNNDSETENPYYKLSSVGVYITDQEPWGNELINSGDAKFIVEVYKYNNETGYYDMVVPEVYYTVSIDDTAKWVTIPFPDLEECYLYEPIMLNVILKFIGRYEGKSITIGADRDREVQSYYSRIYDCGVFYPFYSSPAISLNLNYSGNYPYIGTNNPVLSKDKSKIYPNPNTGTFTIEVEEESKATISNAIGTIMDVFEVKEQQTVTVDYQPGVYFVQLKSKNRQAVHRLIIE